MSPVSTFSGVADGTWLQNYDDPTDRAWIKVAGADTEIFTGTDGVGYLRSRWPLGGPYYYYAPSDLGATMAKAKVRLPAANPTSGDTTFGGVALAIQKPDGTAPTTGSAQHAISEAYFAIISKNGSDSEFSIGKKLTGGSSNRTTWKVSSLAAFWGSDLEIMLRIIGDDVVTYLNNVEVHRQTDTSLRGGHAGIGFWNGHEAARNTAPYGLYQFDAGVA